MMIVLKGGRPVGKNRELEESFERALSEDILAAIARREQDDSQASRRDVVRTSFAGIEGLAWILRQSVFEALESIADPSPAIRMAFLETTFQVDAQGRLTEPAKFIALPTMLRFTIAQAGMIAPDLKVDFSGKDWQRFNDAIAIRNRITHPKSIADLTISDLDIRKVGDGLRWMLQTVELVLRHTLDAQKSFVETSREVLDGLRRQDPHYIDLVKRAQQLNED